MRTRFWRSAGIVSLGAVFGSLAGQLLAHQVPLLRPETVVRFHPSADWAVVRFSIDVAFQVNWLTLVGAAIALLVGRKL
ncbi:MAG: hypothetical protein IRZ33_08325 [Alicyclobacillaceae bacterium]|nr:hypothetical protein [Alicyclobacillaceae bacterium]